MTLIKFLQAKFIFITIFLFTLYMWSSHTLPITKTYMPHAGYLHSVEGEYGPNSMFASQVTAYLNHMNSLTSVDIVPTKGIFPIRIREASKDSFMGIMLGNLDGVALPYFFGCTIYIKSNQVHPIIVMHEYMHCLGYSHVDNEYDLMYPQAILTLSPLSLQGYLDSLSKKMEHRWKNIQN